MKIGVTSQNYKSITGHAGKSRRFIILKNSVDFVARFTEALEIKDFMDYLGFIRSHPTGEAQMFQKILKIECLREPQ